MNGLLYYLIKVTLCSGILYAYYHLLLRNKRFHLYNRYYLLAAVVLSVTLPLLHLPLYFGSPGQRAPAILQTLRIISPDSVPLRHSEAPTAVAHLKVVAILIYGLAACLVAARLLFGIFYIRGILRKYRVEPFNSIYFINTEEPGTPFSFFRWLFWNKEIELRSKQGQQIFRHELFHIEQNHSCDSLLIEITCAVFWVNPFFHLMKKEIKAIHEFLADEFAAKEQDRWDYAQLLISRVLGSSQTLVNSFFQNHLKRRIAMITSSKKPQHQFLRKLMALPIICFLLVLFAFKVTTLAEDSGKPLSVHENREVAAFRNFSILDQSTRVVPDTTKPTDREQKVRKERQEMKTPGNAEDSAVVQKLQELDLQNLKQRAIEDEKAREELKQMLALKQEENEKAQAEFKKLLEERQREIEQAQVEFKKLLAEKQEEQERSGIEFKKLMEQRELAKTTAEEEFKKRMLMNQEESEKAQLEFKKLMEMRKRENEKALTEFKKQMLMRQEESEKAAREFENELKKKNQRSGPDSASSKKD